MMDIIRKKEYWDWLDAKLVFPAENTLKNIQDGYILSKLATATGQKIMEVGGGDSRVLRKLTNQHECWLLDKFEGVGLGPKQVNLPSSIHVVKAYAGDFCQEVPDAYFDVVFSISVIEHIGFGDADRFFADCARMLRPGGKMYHAIDLYLVDENWVGADRALMRQAQRGQEMVANLLRYVERSDWGLDLAQPPVLCVPVTFSCEYATNPDTQLYSWNKAAPSLAAFRAYAQSVSIKAEWVKR